MPWLQSYQELERHPKTLKLMSFMKWDKLECGLEITLGAIHMFWYWTQAYAEDGDLNKYSRKELSIFLKRPTEFIDGLYACGFIDPDNKVHNWIDKVEKYLYSKYHSSNPAKYREILGKYRRVQEKKETPDYTDTVGRIIAHLYLKTGKKFKASSQAVTKNLYARLKEGITEDECIAVIDHRVIVWNKPPRPGQNDMREYLRPSTLFRPTNFENYLVEAKDFYSKTDKKDKGLDDVERRFKK